MPPVPALLVAAPDWSELRAVDAVLRVISGALDGRARLVLRCPAPLLARAAPTVAALAQRRFPPAVAARLPITVAPEAAPLPPGLIEISVLPGQAGLRTAEALEAALLSRGLPKATPGAVAESARWAGPPPEISVLVPTFGRPRALLGLLARLSAQTGRDGGPPPDFELLIIDDGTDPPALDGLDLDAHGLRLRVLRQSNAGPAAARNLALAHCRAPILLLLNDDAVPSDTLVADHAAAWARDPRPRLLMGSFSLLPERRRDAFAALIESSNLLFPQPTLAPGVYKGEILCSGNASLPAASLRAVGGMDDSIRAPGGEDTELGRRLGLVEGLALVYDPELKCGHDHLLTVEGMRARKLHLGQVVAALAERWAEPGLMLPGGPPVDELFDLKIERMQKRLPNAILLAAELDAACAAEREGAPPSLSPENFRTKVDDVSEAAYLEGLLLGRRARPKPARK